MECMHAAAGTTVAWPVAIGAKFSISDPTTIEITSSSVPQINYVVSCLGKLLRVC